jgi:hypothetical protein
MAFGEEDYVDNDWKEVAIDWWGRSGESVRDGGARAGQAASTASPDDAGKNKWLRLRLASSVC